MVKLFIPFCNEETVRVLLFVLVISFPLAVFGQSTPIPNRLIDQKAFLADVMAAHADRESRRVSEERFIDMAGDPNTIILDARTAERYERIHIAGAKSLPFTEFTEQALAKVVPSKETRILIYCNNNVENSPQDFATKALGASLNLSTLPALYTYGYRNVYELGPVIDPETSKILFEGSSVAAK
ncbi:MAG: rhodanese-like domain-containing protein [Deltaproteobacteria bacterium]|nr:rhodanese-like domain-containing protein [Deltaproteobacteria bacterium]